MAERLPRGIAGERRMTRAIAADAFVSCLMVTLPVPHRLPYLRQSVADYCRQTHPRRELVVVLDQGDAQARADIVSHVAALGRDDIRIVDPAGKHTLGALRNRSVEHARGDLVCQWDDDDRYHPERLARQAAVMDRERAAALCLEDTFHFFAATRTLHLLNFRMTNQQAFPGSLMMRREVAPRYPESGASAERGEDSAGLAQLRSAGHLGVFSGLPYLYVYVAHGANTWNDGHHRMLTERLSTSRALLRRNEAEWRAGLAAYDFGPGEVTVRGYNGVAFTLGQGAAESSRRTDTRSA